MKRGRHQHYAGVLDIPEGRVGRVRVRHVLKPAGTVLKTGTLRTELFGQPCDTLTFPNPTRWHELSEKGHGVWMTDYPVEQRQMDDLVATAKGDVLVGGLGLGYAVVALAHRKAVRSITVVERSADVIALVWTATVTRATAYYKSTCPLHIVRADLFDYLQMATKTFTWGLFDIWQGDGEATFHETVVPLRRLAHGKVKTVTCWNEDAIMRGQLLQGLYHRLLFLQRPELLSNVQPMDLQRLCEVHGHVYTDWAVPFWRWYRDHASASPTRVHDVMTSYVRDYGRPERDNGLWVLTP